MRIDQADTQSPTVSARQITCNMNLPSGHTYEFRGPWTSQPHRLYPPDNFVYRTLGEKHYELTDHLGNVRATVTDRKVADFATGWEITGYTADISSAQDYYPGGTMMPGRKFNPGSYRYGGAGGQEMDNEIKGVGNSYTAEHWQYDPRIVRRWNVDPLASHPNQIDKSPYSAFWNNPIFYNDPTGLCPTCPDNANDGDTHTWGNHEFKYNGETGQWATDLPEFSVTADTSPDYLKAPRLEKFGALLYHNSELYSSLMERAPLDIQKEIFMARFNYSRSRAALYVGAGIGIVISPVIGPGLIARESLRLMAYKTVFSAGAQLTFRRGEVNLVGALADGVMVPGAGDLVGAAFEVNFNIRDGSFNTSTVLDTKAAHDVVREAVISSIISMKLNAFDGMAAGASAEGKALYHAPNAFGNYGLQRATGKPTDNGNDFKD